MSITRSAPPQPLALLPDPVADHPASVSWVLASASPRRRALINQLGLAVQSQSSEIAERAEPDELPQAFAQRMAEEKALDVARARHAALRLPNPQGEWVIGGDTVVALGHQILGKPRDTSHALQMLSALSGQTHDVWSGWAVVVHTQTETPEAPRVILSLIHI